MTTLTKSTLTTYIPAVPGTEGSPGTPEIAPTPGTPAWTEVVTVPAGRGIIYWVYVYDQHGNRYASPVYGWIPAYSYTIYHAAVAATPGQAGIPGTPGTPGSPAQITTDLQLGWNASAISVDPLTGSQEFQFSIDAGASGVVVGLNNASLGSGYADIDFAIFAESGLYRVIEHGVIKTGSAAFVTADVFTIRRLGTEIAYFRNSTLIYTSTTASSGDLSADCSLYAGGDAIYNAAFAAIETTYASVTGTLDMDLGGLSARAADSGGYADLAMDLGDLDIAAQVWNVGTLEMDLGGLTMRATDGLANVVRMDLGDLDIHLESGFFIPEVNDLAMDLGGIGIYAEGLVGAVGSLAMNLGSLGMRSGDAAGYATLGMNLGDVDMYLREETFSGASAFLEYSGYEVFGQGQTNNTVLGADLIYSGYTLEAYTGAVADLDYSGYTLAAAGTAPNAANASLILSGYAVSSAATVNNLATVALTYSGYAVQGYGGAVAALEYSGYTLDASGFVGNSANAALVYSGYSLAGTGIINNSASATLVLSGYGTPNQATAALTYSGYTLTADVAVNVTVEYEGYSVTRMDSADGEAWAVTHYTNYPFKQFIRFRNQVYGIATDGVCALTGDTDNGTPIVSVVDFCPTDFAAKGYSGHSLKRPRSMFLYGTLGGDAEVSCIVDQTVDNAYAYRPVRFTPGAYRVHFGRGVKGQWLGFKFTNTNGDDFTLNGIDPEVDVLKNTIWE